MDSVSGRFYRIAVQHYFQSFEFGSATLGYVMKVPQQYSNFTYYGRGPIDNYADRKSGQFIEQYTNSVAGEFVNFPKPQVWAITKMFAGVH